MDRYDELNLQSEPHEVGELDATQRRNGPPPRAGGGMAAWVVLAIVVGAAIAFIWFVYLPEHSENERLRQRISQLDETALKLKADLQTSEEERKTLEDDRTKLSEAVQTKDQVLSELQKTQNELNQKLESEVKKGDVLIHSAGGDLVVDLIDQLMFPSGESDLSDSGKKVLGRVCDTFLGAKDKIIQVAGNTDNLPITGKLKANFPSNWELSTTRANNVVHFLEDTCKIPGTRLASVGYAEFRPASKNTTKEGRRKNRRIEVKLIPLVASGKHK